MAQIKKIANWFFETIKATPQCGPVLSQFSYELSKDAIKGLYIAINDLVIEVVVNLNPRSACFLIRQLSEDNFHSTFSFDGSRCQININHPLICYLLKHRELLLKSNLPGLIQGAQSRAEANDLVEISHELVKHEAAIVGGIYSDQELIGVLLIGAKVDGFFGPNDLSSTSDLLSSSSKKLAQIMHYQKTQVMIFRRMGGEMWKTRLAS